MFIFRKEKALSDSLCDSFIQTFESCPGMGRIAVMDSNQLVMLGKVMSVKYKPYKK